MTPIIAIIGRPNVGKSSLFNRILGHRVAVVEDVPGVTRDRNYRPSSWQGLSFSLVDTGGLMPLSADVLHQSINAQIDIAVAEGNAVLFIVEAGCGVTDDDERIAQQLRKKAKDKVFLLVNKAESSRLRLDIDQFRRLGFGDPWPVSALHGYGVADCMDAVVAFLKKNTSASVPLAEAKIEKQLCVAVVGRPNAGKSSLVNKLLRENRMIVNDAPGTTRDAIDSVLRYYDRAVRLIDTAGLRKKSHVKQDLEYYFNLRAIKSIERCDVCVVMIDANEGIGVQDLRIVNKAFELRKGVLCAWNKWDLVKKDTATFGRLVAGVKRHYLELRPVPMVAISALTGLRVAAVLDHAFAIQQRMTERVPAAEFEDNIFSWVRAHPHPAIPKEPVRFLGARQFDTAFPFFKFFVTNPRNVAPMYVRYLTNKIYDTYGFEGCPMVLEFKSILKGTKQGRTR